MESADRTAYEHTQYLSEVLPVLTVDHSFAAGHETGGRKVKHHRQTLYPSRSLINIDTSPVPVHRCDTTVSAALSRSYPPNCAVSPTSRPLVKGTDDNSETAHAQSPRLCLIPLPSSGPGQRNSMLEFCFGNGEPDEVDVHIGNNNDLKGPGTVPQQAFRTNEWYKCVDLPTSLTHPRTIITNAQPEGYTSRASQRHLGDLPTASIDPSLFYIIIRVLSSPLALSLRTTFSPVCHTDHAQGCLTLIPSIA